MILIFRSTECATMCESLSCPNKKRSQNRSVNNVVLPVEIELKGTHLDGWKGGTRFPLSLSLSHTPPISIPHKQWQQMSCNEPENEFIRSVWLPSGVSGLRWARAAAARDEQRCQ